MCGNKAYVYPRVYRACCDTPLWMHTLGGYDKNTLRIREGDHREGGRVGWRQSDLRTRNSKEKIALSVILTNG